MLASRRTLPRLVAGPLVFGLFAMAACGGGDPSSEVLELGGENLGAEGAHEHGIARLSLAVDDTEVTLDFRAPGASLYGFEHTPRTDAERLARDEAVRLVREELGRFVTLPKEAACEPGEVHLTGEPRGATDPEPDGHDQAGGRDEAGGRGEDAGREDHDDHEETHDHGEAHDHEGEGEGEGDHDGHSEIEARVVLRCAESPEGSTARLRVAEFFPDVVHVDLIVLSGTRQGGARVDPDAAIQL
jgi:hypothetical protein